MDEALSDTLKHLHAAVIDVVSVMNAPGRDQLILDAAGLELDQVLFPLLVLIDRFGPVGVVDVADRVGRDYTTVSRQLDKLERLGLIARRQGAADKRVREAVVTAAGRAMNEAIDVAREKLLTAAFAAWPRGDLKTLSQLMRRFADALMV